MVQQHFLDRVACNPILCLELLEFGGVIHPEPNVEADRDEHCAKQERDAPTERLELLRGHERLRRGEGATGQKQAERGADLREASEETAEPARRMLDREECRAAPLRADGETLHNAQQDEPDNGNPADAGVGRQEPDGGRCRAHDQQRSDEERLAADPVAQVTGDDPTERAREEANRERRKGGENPSNH